MGTFHWFDFIDHYVYGDEIFDEKLIDMFPDRQEEIDAIYDEIDKKINIIEREESDKWHSSKEYNHILASLHLLFSSLPSIWKVAYTGLDSSLLSEYHKSLTL